MKKLAKISAIILVTGLASGCASTSDVDMLKSRVSGLESRVSKVAADMSAVKASSDQASAKATAAEAAANRAARYAQDTNSKLNNMFRKSMMK